MPPRAQPRGEEASITRRSWLITLLAAPVSRSPALIVRRDGDTIRVSAPQLRFLNGKPLLQLKDGSAVSFAMQLTLYTESITQPLARSFDRFILSYDLWEEKFSAVRVGPPQRSASRLTLPAAEAWCLDQTIQAPESLGPQRPFWLRLELRAEDPKELAGVIGAPGINITRLIELFAKNPGGNQPRWVASAGPLRLEDIK